MEKILTPQIRFLGFSEPWQEIKLSKVASRVTRKNIHLESNLPLTISSTYGLISQTDFFNNRVASSDVSGYYLIKNGEFAYNKSYSQGFPFGSVKRLDQYEKGVLSTLYIVFEVTDDISSDYLVCYFETNLWHSEVAVRAAEGARNHGLLDISAEDFFDIRITKPQTKDEQDKIALLHNKLDQQIASKRVELKKLENVKKACMERMFPREGETTPQLRFKCFTDDWKEVQFGKIATLKRGLTYSPSDLSDSNNGVLVLRSSNINEDVFVLNEDDVYVSESAINIDYAKDEDILITSANGSSRLVGKRAIIKIGDRKCVHGGFMLLASAEKPYFINALMGTNWYHRFINKYVAGGNGAIGNLNKGDLETYPVLVPSPAEQEKIGEYFRNLDELLAAKRQEIVKLQNIKQSLLDRMFV